jgi:hypothetical protein
MKANFEVVKDGYIAYKVFNLHYPPPQSWEITEMSILTSNVLANRESECACGINVAPLTWFQDNHISTGLWKVLIRWEWLPGVVVPYNTDGKIRCERIQLLEQVAK